MISLIPSPTPPSRLAKGHPGAQFRSMKISEDVRQYAAEEALAKGMEEKSKEFAEAGAEVYVPA